MKLAEFYKMFVNNGGDADHLVDTVDTVIDRLNDAMPETGDDQRLTPGNALAQVMKAARETNAVTLEAVLDSLTGQLPHDQYD